ncbi:hypothetical protein ACIBVL_30445 [Streptomyces sp. NPDC049687]|uniref:hypothetical protein n=1 Tax=Streptomyces sp. NPDC049687 TaxID=3365596 RepID=UPI0037AF98F1
MQPTFTGAPSPRTACLHGSIRPLRRPPVGDPVEAAQEQRSSRRRQCRQVRVPHGDGDGLRGQAEPPHPHRYELALEATRRPELRAFYDATGAVFRDRITAMVTAAGSTDPARHALSLVAWGEGLMFSCAAGSFATPGPEDVRTSVRELLRGMLGG